MGSKATISGLDSISRYWCSRDWFVKICPWPVPRRVHMRQQSASTPGVDSPIEPRSDQRTDKRFNFRPSHFRQRLTKVTYLLPRLSLHSAFCNTSKTAEGPSLPTSITVTQSTLFLVSLFQSLRLVLHNGNMDDLSGI